MILTLALAGLLLGVQPDSAVEARTKVLASELRCPVCQGLSVQDSPSELAQQMRGLIREQLAAGKSEREVKEFFKSKYGEFIFLAPEPHGFNILAYAIPVLIVAAGGVMIAIAVRKWTAPA